MQPVGIDQRMLRRRDNLDVLKTRGAEAVRDKARGAVHVAGMFRKGTDAWDAEKSLQLFEKARLVLFDESVRGLGHPPL